MILATALRSLRRSPSFTAAAVLVLGLGLGANVVLFNAVHALLWRPLPFRGAERLVTLQHRTPRGDVHVSSSGRNAADLRARVPSIAAVGLAQPAGTVTLFTGARDTVDLDSAGVNSEYLSALGIGAVVGTLFDEQDDLGQAGEARALLAESSWKRHFAADPRIVGRLLTCLDGANQRRMRIVGVYRDQATLPFLGRGRLLTPIAWRHPDVATNRGNVLYRTVLRLKPGVDIGLAATQAGAALKDSELELAEDERGDEATLVPLRSALVSREAPAWLLYAAAALLLLLTTINVASLFLSRALGRRHEAAVRQALGASFGHTLREQLAEAVLTCSGGLAVALALNEHARALIPWFLPELRSVGPELLTADWTIVGFGVGISAAVACVLAILPVLEARRAGTLPALSEGGRSTSARAGWQGVLVSAQLAVILALLTLGGLISRSLAEALAADPGFDASNVVTFRAAIPGAPDAHVANTQDLATVIASVPGIAAVGFSAEPPLGEYYTATHSARAGAFSASDPSLDFRLVDGGYFRALGMRLARGRLLTEAELRGGVGVAVINESAARLLFGGTDPIGRQVHAAFGGDMLTVVGVVRDVHSAGLDRKAPATLYRPYLPFPGTSVVFTVRTSRPADTVLAAVRARAQGWRAGVVVRGAAPLDAELRQTVASRMRASGLLAGFALLGLLVGTVGLYGTISAYVQRLRRELGIRAVLGASAASIRRRVLGYGVRLLVPGIAAGLALSAGVSVSVRKMLYGIDPWDPSSFAVALLLLTTAALAASLVPAVRASRMEPSDALRER